MAGRIPQDFLDQLLARTDLVELVDSRLTLRKTGRNYSACCPFHSEKTASFTVSPEKQFYYCFGCGAHGTAIRFLMEYDRLEFLDAVEDLAGRAGLDIPRDGDGTAAAPVRQYEHLLTVCERAAQFFQTQLRRHPQRDRAVDYLRGRGLDGATVKAFGIGYAPPGWDNLLGELAGDRAGRDQLIEAGLVIDKEDGRGYDRFRDRIMFPIRNRRGRVIGFGGRGLAADAKPKYLNSPETPVFSKGRELYGFYEARQANRKLDRVLITEGYMDVVALAQHGISCAVASLGTSTTAPHLEQLFRASAEIVFCYDGDRAGRAAAWRALEQTLPLLGDGRRAKFFFMPDGEDPDTLVRQIGGDELLARLGGEALPLSDYLFQQLGDQLDLDSLDGRARLVELARPLLAQLPPGALQTLMQERLAELAGTTVERLGLNARSGVPAAPAAPSRPPHRARAERSGYGITSLPERTLGLLLSRTALAAKAGDLSLLHNADDARLTLLLTLIELLRERPHITVAQILERYRDRDDGRRLEQLAIRQFEIGDDDERLENEFIGNMNKLRSQHADPQRYLLDKLSRGEISAEEREQLRRMAARRPLAG